MDTSWMSLPRFTIEYKKGLATFLIIFSIMRVKMDRFHVHVLIVVIRYG